MNPISLQSDVKRGLAWVAGASAFVAVLDVLALIIILKFWIGLEEFGIATTVLAFHGTFELLAEIGLTSAIIQKANQNEVQLSTIYWLNLLLGLGVFAMICLAAPMFAALHDNQTIIPLFRLYAVHIVIRSFYSCQQALMKRDLRFKELSLIRLLSNTGDFIVRITAAAHGFGPASFILGLLTRTAVEGVGVILQSGWRPRLLFQFAATRDHLVFGLKASASEIVYRTYSNADYWVVSFFFGPAALGLYRAAYELVLEPVRFISLIVVNVAFPAFSRLKTQKEQLAEQYLSFTRQNLMVIGLFVACILVSAEEILPILLSPAYAEAAWAARVLAVVGTLRALSHLGPPLLDGVGKPGLTLLYQCLSAVILTSSFVLFASLLGENRSYNGVALAWTIGYPIDCFILAMLVFRTLQVTPMRFVRELAPLAAPMIIASIAGYGGRSLVAETAPLLQLGAGMTLTILVYLFSLSYLAGVTPRSLFRVNAP